MNYVIVFYDIEEYEMCYYSSNSKLDCLKHFVKYSMLELGTKEEIEKEIISIGKYSEDKLLYHLDRYYTCGDCILLRVSESNTIEEEITPEDLKEAVLIVLANALIKMS